MSQNPDQHYIQKTYTVSEGLPNNAVFMITRDKFGFLWLATWDGLSRFDGFRFKNYRHDPNDTATLPYFWPENVRYDGSGNLWVTTNIIARFDYNSERFVLYGPGSSHYYSSKQIFATATDQNGNFFVIGPKGISIYNIEKDRFDDIQTFFRLTPSSFNLDGDLMVSSQHCIILDYQNRQILLGRYDSSQQHRRCIIFDKTTSFPYTPVPSGNFIQEVRLHKAKNGNYFIASNLGLFYLDMVKYETTRLFRFPDSLLASLDQDMIWSSVDEGLTIYRSASKKLVHFPVSLSNRVTNTFFDGNDMLWYGCFDEGGSGLGLQQIIFRTTPWKHFSLQEGPSSGAVSVFALHEDISAKAAQSDPPWPVIFDHPLADLN